MRSHSLLLNLAAISQVMSVPNPNMRLQDNLNEPNGYGFCLDLPGMEDIVTFTGIQTHSCKPDVNYNNDDNEDQMFYPEQGAIKGYGDATGLCL